MEPPISSADESFRTVREAAVKKRIRVMAKQHHVNLDNVTIDSLAAEVQKRKTKLDERRRTRHSFAKFGNALQRFAKGWSQLSKVYAGMNEVAKGIDNQYGAIASGALMVLLQVHFQTIARDSKSLMHGRLERIKKAARGQ